MQKENKTKAHFAATIRKQSREETPMIVSLNILIVLSQ